jgi:signal transduction histidine kinase
VKVKSPSGPTLVTCALLVLLPALAVLQYRWVGQVSIAERERMQRNLRIAAFQFREAFDGEIVRAFLNLQVGPGTAREGGSDRYSDRYDAWLDTAAHPKIVDAVLLVDAADGRLRLRRWNASAHTFDTAEWPATLEKWRPQFEADLESFSRGQFTPRRSTFGDERSLIVAPIRNPFVGDSRLGTQSVTPVFGYTVLQLDMAYVREQMLPALAQRHFMHTEGGDFRVAVISEDAAQTVLYQSDPGASIDIERADTSTPLLDLPDRFFARTPPTPGPPGRDARDGFESGRVDAGQGARRGRDDNGRWRLVVQHQSGSLEAAVGAARQRNLAISFSVLLMLTVSVGLLLANARRSHRLAHQQMEFVAGVSHELRTPVAVIRSAAENLSQGVIGSGERVKRYGQVIEGEARRLGEMVERVLQYAGIESSLRFGARVQVSPAELIEAAIDGALSAADTAGVTVHRDLAGDLPSIAGDGPALRSAIENLVANAIKYGGRDRWVGVQARPARERRRSAVRITVSDHGDGIPASELPHIFEPFYRGADALARQVHGNGLGLSLVKRIVTAHGGRVTVTSKAGSGTAFSVVLPAAEPDARPTRVANEVQAPAHS